MNEPIYSAAEAAHRLDRERNLVLEWLRADVQRPFVLVANTQAELLAQTRAINENFLQRIGQAGFDSQLVAMAEGGLTTYEVRWTWRGSSFVGFKQPAPEERPDDAILAGCAALLENQWCRQRLSH